MAPMALVRVHPGGVLGSRGAPLAAGRRRRGGRRPPARRTRRVLARPGARRAPCSRTGGSVRRRGGDAGSRGSSHRLRTRLGGRLRGARGGGVRGRGGRRDAADGRQGPWGRGGGTGAGRVARTCRWLDRSGRLAGTRPCRSTPGREAMPASAAVRTTAISSTTPPATTDRAVLPCSGSISASEYTAPRCSGSSVSETVPPDRGSWSAGPSAHHGCSIMTSSRRRCDAGLASSDIAVPILHRACALVAEWMIVHPDDPRQGGTLPDSTDGRQGLLKRERGTSQATRRRGRSTARTAAPTTRSSSSRPPGRWSGTPSSTSAR